ncbi:hypothetical protein [Vibrio panuliri]|uniref:Uncharacterized protein n=1 Tax=Vibrio panuliri TaxID=1381081 RepID=A0ABX3FK93_9VIBR|nr:hypothetical protein [Vibrio panuliri]KAB1460869.1 hypothetical protein F7O85_00395 [Vibrio panuliri]OLQ91674.1 hypothetical protein BIY20_09735 [Vibrio panuliri]
MTFQVGMYTPQIEAVKRALKVLNDNIEVVEKLDESAPDNDAVQSFVEASLDLHVRYLNDNLTHILVLYAAAKAAQEGQNDIA